jgi:hypothetical protein
MAFSRCARAPWLRVGLSLGLLSLVGCSRQESAEQALNKALIDAGQTRVEVFPLGGSVTIDGGAPMFAKGRQRVYVMLNDLKAPEAPMHERRYAVCDSNGQFTFQTYVRGDGVAAGNYVVTFAVLHDTRKSGVVGPDGLKNLYNDPEKNARIPEFKIEHKAPGKSDYLFNLAVAGETAVSQPGKFALTGIKDR